MPQTCSLCSVDPSAVLWKGNSVRAIRDTLTIASGRVIVAPIRHVAQFAGLTRDERSELLGCIEEVGALIQSTQTDQIVGLDVGVRVGQTAQHVHLELHWMDCGKSPSAVEVCVALSAPNDGRRLRRYPVPTQSRFLDGRAGNELLGPLLAVLEDAAQVDIASAFITHGGLDLIESTLRRVADRPSARIRIVTGDYLDFNEPSVLRRLNAISPCAQIYVVESARSRGFHAKSYIVRTSGGESWMFVGSSNLTANALCHSAEWNVVIDGVVDPHAIAAARDSFEACLRDGGTLPLTEAWIVNYEGRRRVPSMAELEGPPADARARGVSQTRDPTPVQQQALEALADDLRTQSRAGLVVLATGLGKTFLAAFAYRRFGFKRCLFVAHREEILDQAATTFLEANPGLKVSRLGAGGSDVTGDIVVASVQSIGRIERLHTLQRNSFDLIVVDEFHHATATQYRRVLGYFEPRYSLGLTATPRRTDREDVLGLCGGNLVYECDLFQGIAGGFLAPFDYFGIADPVDYQRENLFARNLSPEELGDRLAFDRRAEVAAAAWREHIGPHRSTLVFCASLNHARFMRRYFERVAPDVPSAIIHSGSDSDPRAEALKKLREGSVRLVFSVDMLNEGVDVPQVDGVLLLRPTDSPVLFLQQLGRGLRMREGKRLKVVDFVGNHHAFLSRMLFMQGVEPTEFTETVLRLRSHSGHFEHSCGSTARYEIAAIDLLEQARQLSLAGNLLREWFCQFEISQSRRPTFREAVQRGFYSSDGEPRSGRIASWAATLYEFAERAREVTAPGTDSRRFIDAVQKVRASSPLKLLVLELFVHAHFAGRCSVEDCLAHVRRRIIQDPRIGVATGWRDEATDSENGVVKLRKALEADDGLLSLNGDGLIQLDSGCDVPFPEACTEIAAEVLDGRIAATVEAAARLRSKSLRDLSRVSINEAGVQVDARWSWEWDGEHGRLTLFARGTSDAADLNREYGEGMRLLLARLSELNATVLSCFIDSARAQELPLANRLLKLQDEPYPIHLRPGLDAVKLRKKIQAAQARIGQLPGTQGGNNTRRIALMLEIPAEHRSSITGFLETGCSSA